MNLRTIKNVAPSVAVAIGALALVSTLIVRTSDAAFTATVSSPGNSFQAGTVTLSASTASALININAMEPSQFTTACLVVNYDGTIVDPEPISLHYLTGGTIQGSASLAPWLLMDVEQSPATAPNCGFVAGSGTALIAGERLSAFATRDTYALGTLGWDPTSGDLSRAFRFTITLDPLTPNTQQGLTVTDYEFVWEITS